MTRRVVLGQQNDGSMGLRVSASGVDAFSGAGQAGDFTFNSDWSDIAQIHAIGLVSWTSNSRLDTLGNPIAGFLGVWPNLGYKPFTEIRLLQGGNVVCDDFFNATFPGGSYCITSTDRFTVDSASVSDQFLFIAYKIPVPSQ